jgi:outer membrane protein
MRKIVKVLGMVAGLAAAPFGAGAETLADAMVSAYKTSHLLDQNQAVLRAADEDAAIAVANLRPVINFVAQTGWRKYNNGTATSSLPTAHFETTSTSLSMTGQIVIWAGGRGRLAADAARESVLATRSALVSVEQEVLLAAVSAYVRLGLAQEIVALRESNVRVITRELRAAKDRFDVGEITQTDVSQAEAALAAAQANLAAAQGDLMIAREAYKAAVGHYPDRLAGLPKTPSVPKSLEEAKSVAGRGHPGISQVQHQVKAAELGVQIAKAGLGPTVAGEIGVTTDTDSGVSYGSVGLSMSQTVYAGGGKSATYRKALANKEAAAAGLLQTTVSVEQGVGQAWAGLVVANASIAATRQQIAAAQKAFDGVKEEANLGARTTLDVLNAEQDLLAARASRLEAEASRYIGVYSLLATMGLLTADHLKLGVPTYDPEAYYNAVKNAPAMSAQGKALDRIMKTIGK